MSIKTSIKDGSGTNAEAKVTSRGQLVTSPLEFSTPVTLDLDTTGIVFNFFEPRTGKVFIITDIFVHTNRSAPVAGTIIDIFEANAIDSIIPQKDIFKTDLPRQGGEGHTGLNWLVSEGVWLNATTDTSTGISTVTVAGYYIEA